LAVRLDYWVRQNKGGYMHHKLKIDEPYLRAKIAGDKLFEIRLNDRGYQKGDSVEYMDYFTHLSKPIRHIYEITYVTGFKQEQNYVVFGEKHISSEPA
jgi:hypothetical protein